jgi:sortase A
MRALRITGNIFILIGATFLFFVLYEIVGTSAITRGHQSALAAEFEEPEPVVEPTPEASPVPKPVAPPKIGAAFARITIPKLDVRYIVVEGTSLTQLAKGPGHYRGSAMPGQEGSVGVAGHRTGWGSPFIDLDRLGKGDRVIVELKRGDRFVYEVTRTTVVQPGDVWVLDGDPRSKARFTLTLTTCTPKYTARDRLVIWADQVVPAPVADEPTSKVSRAQARAAA